MSGGSGSSSSSPTKASSAQRLRPPLHLNGHGHRHHHHHHHHHHGRSPPPSPRLQPLPPPLLLTIRFSTSLPDLHLDIPRPSATTVVALKHLIRSRLEEPTSQRRLRFIHAGRILPDQSVLSSVLRQPPSAAAAAAPPPPSSYFPPPPPPPPPSSQTSSSKSPAVVADAAAAAAASGKGKAVEGAAPALPRVYVNCSIGDLLTDAELAEEAAAAAVEAVAPPPPSPSPSPSPFAPLSPSQSPSPSRNGGTTTDRNTPRGFDRLLAAGFSAAEVNQLRLQFRSIQASRHTPDTMPSPDALRSMEDAWMDNNNGGNTQPGGGAYGGADGEGGGGGGGDGGDELGLNGVVDVLLRGMLIGFVWPLGSFGWLIREEGLYSRRWKVFVSFGFVLSLTIGMIRSISGENK
ncbi:hypothetical protein RB594_006546 [Gaeumannomyces avenae]